MSYTESESIYTRTAMMLTDEGVDRLRNSRVAVIGVGGVGGYAVEALARAGVGSLLLVDADRVNITNINRQIIATQKTVGAYKTEAARERIREINPDCTVECINVFYSEKTKDGVDLSGCDFIIDAIDSVGAKVFLISEAKRLGVPVISSMGAGNKLDPTRFRVSDISRTHTDPLAKAVRTLLRKRGINHLPVVFSDEEPRKREGERVPGSISFVPSVVGLILAGEVILRLSGMKESKSE